MFKKKLECSSRGDKRFSALYAKVRVNGVLDSIENHYQLSKRFGNEVPKTWRDAKGRKPTHFVVNETNVHLDFLSAYYMLLWIKYFDNNSELIEYASKFNVFTDMFSKKGCNSQADVIEYIVNNGREKVMSSRYIKEFIEKIS